MNTNDQRIINICTEIKNTYGDGKKCFVESYGCQMNDHDKERILGMLKMMGYECSDSKENADFILFNTCCVREHAEKRVFGNIGALKKQKDENPNLIIAVCGCMMQQKAVSDRTFKRFPFVNMIFGTHELDSFPEMMQSVLSGERILKIDGQPNDVPEGIPSLRQNSFSTTLVIMYGCNNFCSYCIVPYVRGRERSRSVQNILEEANTLSKAGYKEIQLLGQNVNSYSSPEGISFPDLLRKVNEIDGFDRIRFMTSHPKDLSDDLIYAMRDCSKVCNHIHLPVQSGSDRILQLMNRRYSAEKYLNVVDKLRANVPDVEITTDIIVGFPTETDEDFSDTVELVKKVGYSSAYTFMYSPRPGTRAAVMEGQIPEDVKKERLLKLNSVCAELLKEQNKKYIGKKGTVLVEGADNRGKITCFGKLTNFKMVYFEGDSKLIGQTVQVEITDTQSNSLIGKRIDY